MREVETLRRLVTDGGDWRMEEKEEMRLVMGVEQIRHRHSGSLVSFNCSVREEGEGSNETRIISTTEYRCI